MQAARYTATTDMETTMKLNPQVFGAFHGDGLGIGGFFEKKGLHMANLAASCVTIHRSGL